MRVSKKVLSYRVISVSVSLSRCVASYTNRSSSKRTTLFHRHDTLFSNPLKPKDNLHITTEGLLRRYVISSS